LRNITGNPPGDPDDEARTQSPVRKAPSSANAPPPASQQTPRREDSPQKRDSRAAGWKWLFPVGIGLAGLASAAAILFRGCWHRNMSWPVRAQDEHGDFSYQTCNDCGIMRLFDERAFRGYGSYGYDLHALIAHERLLRRQRLERAERERLNRRTP
jgi:hypothetical protein